MTENKLVTANSRQIGNDLETSELHISAAVMHKQRAT